MINRIVFILVGLVMVFKCNAYTESDSLTNKSNEYKSVKEILHQDGTLRLKDEFSGSFDMTGYRLISALGEQPRFAPVLSNPDDQWFTNFNTLDIDGLVLALHPRRVRQR